MGCAELTEVACTEFADSSTGMINGSGDGEGGRAACAVAVANRGGSGSTWQEVAIKIKKIKATQKHTDVNGIGLR